MRIMKPLKLRIVKYPHSSTSRYVIEGLRIEGKRVRKFFATKTAAETWVEQKNIQIDHEGRKAALEMPHSLRVMALQCSENLKPYGKTIADASRFYIEHLKQTERSCTVSKLVEEFVKGKASDGKSEIYLKDLKNRFNRFSRDFGTRIVATITMREVDDWLRDLGLSPQSRNNFRTVLCVLFNDAVNRGYCSANPVAKTAKAKIADESPKIFTVSQIASLLNVADSSLLPYLAIGAFAGLRPAETARLDWSEVNLQRGLIEIKASKSKTATRRFVKIQPCLAKWLAPYSQRKGRISPLNLRNKIADACQKSDLKEWPPNGLRHSYASYHLAHFNDAAALALQMGHADTGMIFAHYRELVRPDEGERYWNIEPSGSAEVIPFQNASSS